MPDKKAKFILIITVLILLLCAVWAAFALRKPSGQRVFIIQENKIIQELDLASEKDQEIRIASPDGGYNIIRIQNHEICISEADCPDQTCIKTGILRSENLPIVCLPHKLIIRFAEEGEQP